VSVATLRMEQACLSCASKQRTGRVVRRRASRADRSTSVLACPSARPIENGKSEQQAPVRSVCVPPCLSVCLSVCQVRRSYAWRISIDPPLHLTCKPSITQPVRPHPFTHLMRCHPLHCTIALHRSHHRILALFSSVQLAWGYQQTKE